MKNFKLSWCKIEHKFSESEMNNLSYEDAKGIYKRRKVKHMEGGGGVSMHRNSL